jgi:hypothetical protein
LGEEDGQVSVEAVARGGHPPDAPDLEVFLDQAAPKVGLHQVKLCEGHRGVTVAQAKGEIDRDLGLPAAGNTISSSVTMPPSPSQREALRMFPGRPPKNPAALVLRT